MKREQKQNLWRHIILIGVGFFLLYPVIFMLFASFKNSNEIFASSNLLPEKWLFENYKNGWASGAAGTVTFTNFFINTFALVIPVVAATVVSCTLVAYGFGRFDFPLKKVLFPVLLATLMLPNTVIIIPRFMFFKKIGWLDSYLPFLVPALFAAYPFFIFMLIQFLRGVPCELDESAKMDGCNSFQILIHILLPILKPAVFSAGLFQFLWTWNDFYNQFIFINTPAKFTLSLGLRLSVDASTEAVKWNEVMAMSVCSVIPLFLLFFCAQKYFVDGIATSGLKG